LECKVTIFFFSLQFFLAVVSEFIPIFGGFRRLFGDFKGAFRGFSQNVTVFQCEKIWMLLENKAARNNKKQENKKKQVHSGFRGLNGGMDLNSDADNRTLMAGGALVGARGALNRGCH
jgi:hypothetical protein